MPTCSAGSATFSRCAGENDWPLIGIDQDAEGLGKPVLMHRKPTVPQQPIAIPQTSDDFYAPTLGLQWQWHANHRDGWHSLTKTPGSLWLRAVKASPKFAEVPNLLLQKFPATRFSVETQIGLRGDANDVDAGLIVMGQTHAALAITFREGKPIAALLVDDVEIAHTTLNTPAATLRVDVDPAGVCRFSIRSGAGGFVPIGSPFQATPRRWIGAKVGLWCRHFQRDDAEAGAQVDSFRFA